MSETALTNLREYLTGTLQPQDLMWLINELAPYAAMPEGTLEPYTMEEINARIDEAERQSAAGEYTDHEDVMKELFADFEEEEDSQYRKAV